MRRIVFGPRAVVEDFAARVDAWYGCPMVARRVSDNAPQPTHPMRSTMARVYYHKTDTTLAAYVVRVGVNRAGAVAVIQAIRDKPLAQRTAADRAILQELSAESDWSSVWAEAA